MTAPAAPTEPILHEAALGYLAARSASTAQLRAALERKIATWSRRADKAGVAEDEIVLTAERCRAAIDRILARLKENGLLDDARYAKLRAERLTRSGKSSRAVAFDLKQKGIASSISRDVVPTDAETELGAAVALAKKKRIGPFARAIPDDREGKRALEQKWLGAFGRGGFSFGTAQKVLRLNRDAAEEILYRVAPRGW